MGGVYIMRGLRGKGPVAPWSPGRAEMLTHVVLFSLKPGAAADAGDRIVADALEQLSQIPGVQHLSAGKVMQAESEYDYGLAMQFADRAALKAYRVHPVHQAYVAFLGTATAKRLAYDFVN